MTSDLRDHFSWNCDGTLNNAAGWVFFFHVERAAGREVPEPGPQTWAAQFPREGFSLPATGRVHVQTNRRHPSSDEAARADWVIAASCVDEASGIGLCALRAPGRKLTLSFERGVGLFAGAGGEAALPLVLPAAGTTVAFEADAPELLDGLVSLLLGELDAFTASFTDLFEPSTFGSKSAGQEAVELLAGPLGLTVIDVFGRHRWTGTATAAVARGPGLARQALAPLGRWVQALPGQPCPDCRTPLVDPKPGVSAAAFPPTGGDYDSVGSHNIDLQCPGCGAIFHTHTDRTDALSGGPPSYKLG